MLSYWKVDVRIHRYIFVVQYANDCFILHILRWLDVSHSSVRQGGGGDCGCLTRTEVEVVIRHVREAEVAAK